MTSGKWLSRIARSTATYWIMINDLTFCIYSTSSRTRINTFLIGASFVKITIGTNSTFRSTRRWRAQKSLQTRTNSLAIIFSTTTVRSTWRRTTWIYVNDFHWAALSESVSCHSRWTSAHRNVIVDIANCALTT